MNPQQLDAYNRFKLCSERKRVLDILSLDDVRGEETNFFTHWLFQQLNDILLLGALVQPEITWTADALGESILGDTSTPLKDGHESCTIRLHPTLRCYIKPEYTCKGQSLLEERLGTISHKLLHDFVMQFACFRCNTDNHCCHGRAWQRITKATEEESLRMLGVEVILDRLTGMLCDRENDHQGQGFNDVEAWGFLESL